ncbi:MAG: hypothetical protein WC460_00270 [Patescibacteria group bacterium]
MDIVQETYFILFLLAMTNIFLNASVVIPFPQCLLVKTATSLATFEDLMKTDISFYQKLKPYFPKVFRESIDPKYRDKIKFN